MTTCFDRYLGHLQANILRIVNHKCLLNPLKTAQTALFRPSSYIAASTFHLCSQFMLYGAEVAVCSEINTKQIHCGQNVNS
jgi:hypothetical protein